MTVELWSNDLVTKMANIGTAKTLSDGSFSKVFTVPAQVDDSYKIKAYYGEKMSGTARPTLDPQGETADSRFNSILISILSPTFRNRQQPA